MATRANSPKLLASLKSLVFPVTTRSVLTGCFHHTAGVDQASIRALRASLSMSKHLHSHAEPHSFSFSEHSWQFELRPAAPSLPFSFHLPMWLVPTLNLSFNPPLFCGRLQNTHPPLPPPPHLLMAPPLPNHAQDNSFTHKSAAKNLLQPNKT